MTNHQITHRHLDGTVTVHTFATKAEKNRWMYLRGILTEREYLETLEKD